MKTTEADGQEDCIATDERRRAPRKPTRRTTGKIYAPGHEKDVQGMSVNMIDLSLHGAGFTSTEPLTEGERYGLEIRGNWMNLSSRIQVISCRAGDGDLYEIGVEFC